MCTVSHERHSESTALDATVCSTFSGRSGIRCAGHMTPCSPAKAAARLAMLVYAGLHLIEWMRVPRKLRIARIVSCASTVYALPLLFLDSHLAWCPAPRPAVQGFILHLALHCWQHYSSIA